MCYDYVTFFAAALILSGCSSNADSRPTVGDTSDNLVSSEYNSNLNTSESPVSFEDPISSVGSAGDGEIKELIDNFPVESITMPDGTTVSKYEAVTSSNTNNTYQLVFDFSFIRYAEGMLYTSIDDQALFDMEKNKFGGDLVFDSPKYVKIEAGDKLENGLVVKSAEHSVYPPMGSEEYPGILYTNAEFEGRLTLSGVLYLYNGNNDFVGSPGHGDLVFFVDPSQSDLLPMAAHNSVDTGRDRLRVYFDDEIEFGAASDVPMIYLGNINDISVDLSDIIAAGECAKVKITVDNISTGYYNTLDVSVGAALVSVEPVR